MFFLNDKYRYWYRRYWPCIYSVLDRYQNMQYRTPLLCDRQLGWPTHKKDDILVLYSPVNGSIPGAVPENFERRC